MSLSTTRASGPMGPDELQRRLEEFLRQNLPGASAMGSKTPNPGDGSRPVPSKESDGPKERPAPTPDAIAVDLERFQSKPRDIKRHLDRFVIRQEEAKKVLSVALCDHYNAVREAHAGRPRAGYTKQNVVLLGPTGVGKTYLIRSIAELIGVPFVKADATKFSETGYVGGDVEDLVRDLVRRAEGDVRRAEFGIIYIDEIDKLAAPANASGRDVSGRGVQTNLLKLMEETEVPVRAPNDMAGQFQAMMDLQRGGKRQPATINTRHILFIVSGAFGGLEKIVARRVRESTIGFAPLPTAPMPGVPGGARAEETADFLARAETRDFVDFGFEPEFIGRLPVRVNCHPLSEEDLYEILKSSEGSIIRQVEASFAAYGVEVLFREDGLRRLAALAAPENTGARGLMTVCERVFREFKYELPSTAVKRFEVGAGLVDDPRAALAELMARQAQEERVVLRRIVHEFADRFRQSHGLLLRFTEEAAGFLVEEAQAAGRPVRDYCTERFRDFQFGLRLIAQNSGRQEFEIDVETARAPERVLSEWVVASYRQAGTTPPSGDPSAAPA